MNRDQKAAFIDNVAERVEGANAIFAVDYRGISVPQVAELRAKLGEADASFQVVKNTLTLRALDKADSAGKPGVTDLKEFLEGPTAFTYVTGDVALAVKAIANFTKEYELLTYKGGIMDGQVITTEQFTALTKLPSRDVLNGQLVGMLAAPITGVVRTLNALISGLAIQLGQIAEQGLVGNAAKPAADAPEAKPVADAPEATDAADTADAPDTADTADDTESSS
ncbi:MAG: 50S ribosomal protein L10 [Thermoleophilia bacterium]|nr:50S ribosomal protein L10 [Thermoleophilia bacterium]